LQFIVGLVFTNSFFSILIIGLVVLFCVISSFVSISGILLWTPDITALVDRTETKPTELGAASTTNVRAAVHTTDSGFTLWTTLDFPLLEQICKLRWDVRICLARERRVGELFAGCANL